MIKDGTLTIDALELYAPVDKRLKKQSVAVPGTMSDDLNGAGASCWSRSLPTRPCSNARPAGRCS